MADAPEIPEAKDAFEKQVAVTIASLAVVLAVIGNKGDNAKTDAIIKTNEAANKWGHYQSKSIKSNIATAEQEMLTLLAVANAPDASAAQKLEEMRAKVVARIASKTAEYEKEMPELMKEAVELQKDASQQATINDRCDMASLALQIAIVIASVAILSRMRVFWFISIVLGLLGAVIGATTFLM